MTVEYAAFFQAGKDAAALWEGYRRRLQGLCIYIERKSRFPRKRRGDICCFLQARKAMCCRI